MKECKGCNVVPDGFTIRIATPEDMTHWLEYHSNEYEDAERLR